MEISSQLPFYNNSKHMAFSFRAITQFLLILPIRLYQYVISPLTPAACRHVPTCSEYAAEAIRQHGAATGGKLAANRILRCHPWGTSGFDPVPKIIIKKINMKGNFSAKHKLKSSDRLKHSGLGIVVLLFALLIFGAGCSGNRATDQKPLVLVSILPHKYFVEQIAGDLAEVLVLIPPGTSPHAYDPTARQMHSVSKADLYFYNGYLTFEQQLLPALRSNNPEIKTVMLTRGVELIAGHECNHDDHDHHHHHHDGIDPHTWLSVRNARIKGLNILQALTEKYPEHIDVFMENFADFEEKLMDLDDEISEMMALLTGRTFMIYHPALGYFAHDYLLEQLSIEHEGKEPSPSQLRASIDEARQAGVKVVFVQKEFDSENARLVAGELGAQVIQLDPLAENWHDNMLRIAEAIQAANN